MANGVYVLVATPGRLIDHMQDRTVRIDGVEVFVLDEADHMLDLGFVVPIRRIASQIPARRQTLFFSATMPTEIGALAKGMLNDPAQVAGQLRREGKRPGSPGDVHNEVGQPPRVA